MTFDPTRPGAPQQPYTPAPPEPFSPAAPEGSAVPTSPVVASAPVLATPPASAAKRKSGGGWLNIVLVIAAAVAIGGVAFAVGRSTAPVSAATGANGRGTFGGNFPNGSFAPRASGQPGLGRGGFGGGLSISGTVESVDGTTMTIKTANGQTIQVTTGASTTYHAQTPATASDVKTGSNVEVQLDVNGGAAFGRPGASAAPAGPIGTAGSVTVVP